MQNLFGDDFLEADKRPTPVKNFTPWSLLEKLEKEQEVLGIYISAHPLDPYELEILALCNTTTADLNLGLEKLKNKTTLK